MEIQRTGQAEGGPATQIAATSLVFQNNFSNLAVVASRNGQGNLRVQVWRVSDSDSLTLKAEEVEGAVSKVAVAPIQDNRVAVAMRDASGNLRVIGYEVSAGGARLSRLPGTATAGKIQKVSAASFDPDSIITAARLANGQVRITRWAMRKSGEFEEPTGMLLGTAGTPDDPDNLHIDVCASQGLGVLATRTEGGSLRLRAFNGVASPDGSGTGGKIFNTSISGNGFTGYFVGTIVEPNITVRTGLHGLSGRLILDTGTVRLAKWRFEHDNSVKDLEETSVGELEGMAAIAWEIKVLDCREKDLAVTALAGADTYEKPLEKDRGKPKLRMVLWKEANGKLERVAQANAGGKHRELCLTMLSTEGTEIRRFLSASRVGDEMKLAVWRITD